MRVKKKKNPKKMNMLIKDFKVRPSKVKIKGMRP